MNLLIVAATELEIGPFLQKKNNEEVLITGLGIAATVFSLTKRLMSKDFDFVIQAGIGGAFNKRFDLGEVVKIQQDTFADSGIVEGGNFKTLFELGFINENDFPYTKGWLVNPEPLSFQNHLAAAKGVTVNAIGENGLQNKWVREKFSPDIESMEGAAFHYVCLQKGIRFLQLRGISNYVGERDKTKWKLKESIENLNATLLNIIEKI